MSRRRIKKAPYFRLFCGWWQDPRVLALSLDAEVVYIRSIAYSKDNRLDGHLPERALLILFAKVSAPPSVVAGELETAGLWAISPGGWQIRNWSAYQTLAAEDDAEQKNNRERQARHRQAKENGHEPSGHDDAAAPHHNAVGAPPGGH